ncbi:hypothetical protein COV93_05565 [Candidatus Woesearchaeota archaeon CG11_big_fil_rev_8_21_14_0_20_43_8]|nr:MAG: hypothetical protein COV93_05565 [Candidatus Woesearchaeota archaeon CG11_big_fil_rev_8_21_14_0_20_43_8]PIO04807.1 MAG: hypothetical protein COT47_07435 [Candidatus Woesearchaeota archaeon CG08_land_8_20_14_0_20_43_7]
MERTAEQEFEEFLSDYYDINTISIPDVLPRQIMKDLTKNFFGQDLAAEIISSAVASHYRWAKKCLRTEAGMTTRGQHILLYGPTGGGKTYSMELIAEFLGVPFIQTQATRFTEAGYVGDDLENILKRLIDAADGDQKKAQLGIVCLDEVDKLAKRDTGTKDVSGEGVQNGLLPFLDGSVMNLRYGTGAGAKEVAFDTSNVLFVLTGAFSGMHEIIQNKHKSAIGFGSDSKKKEDFMFDYSMVEIADFVKYGIIPELLGRLPIMIPFQAHTKETLRQILDHGRDSIMRTTAAEMKEGYGITLEFSECAKEYAVEKALELKTGGRGLKYIKGIMHRYICHLPSTKRVKYTVTKDHLTHPENHLDEIIKEAEACEAEGALRMITGELPDMMLDGYTISLDENSPEEFGFELMGRIKYGDRMTRVIYQFAPLQKKSRLMIDIEGADTVSMACPGDARFSRSYVALYDCACNGNCSDAVDTRLIKLRDDLYKMMKLEKARAFFAGLSKEYNPKKPAGTQQ